MKSHARVVVIGGGVVGCSVLYHLARAGWRDVVLLERSELTAGSTWHAAGGMHTLNGDPNVAALQDYTIKLYREIESESGVSCGIHQPGCLYLAVTEHELEFFRAEHTKARHLGMALDFITLDEARRLNPLIETSDYRAAMFDPNDGYVDPSGVTNAYAQAARNRGAEIYKHTPVTQVTRSPEGDWVVQTPKGTLRCEYIVNAAGLWAREVGRLIGGELPILPMEHQYIITNDVPELATLGAEIPAAVDFDGAAYLRQERQGLLLGTYEQNCRHWALNGTPQDFGVELLPSDLERIAEPLSVVMDRMPALGRAGIKRIVNGAMVFTPDGNPIIGPLPGAPTAFVAAGVMAGFSQGGGVGLAVARWITEGEPGMDVFAMDVARFGDYANRAYVLEKTRENYQRRFILSCPNEELPAARPMRTTPLYDRLVARGAVFGTAAGWEVPLWFADDPASAHEVPSFRRSNAFGSIQAECRAVRESAGLWETSVYCKIEVSGPDATPWLDGIVANRLPAVGRVSLGPLLTPRGRILGDVTVAHLVENRFLLIGSPVAESLYLRWLTSRVGSSRVSVSSRTHSLSGLSLTGPSAREVLARVCDIDVSNDQFPFLNIRQLIVGLAPVTAMRVSFTGELGYELYMSPEYQRQVHDVLWSAGASVGLRHFGVRALNSLRIEKGYGSWGREYTQDFTPAEAGLRRLICTDKGDFVGRDAIAAHSTPEPRKQLRLLAIGSEDPDPAGGEPVLRKGAPVARLTSAGFGFTVGHSLGLAYLPTDVGVDTAGLEVEVLGRRLPARVLEKPPYDPTGARLRS
ncbi:MAG TPA: FAD-dependent oxidoreductase [Steroidobacteraceae bacterium]|nr:FAD-dependent oxidoreductase [Steroidobacteraceae bacterium]